MCLGLGLSTLIVLSTQCLLLVWRHECFFSSKFSCIIPLIIFSLSINSMLSFCNLYLSDIFIHARTQKTWCLTFLGNYLRKETQKLWKLQKQNKMKQNELCLLKYYFITHLTWPPFLIEILVILLSPVVLFLGNTYHHLTCWYTYSVFIYCLLHPPPPIQYKHYETKDFVNSWASIQQMFAKYLLYEQVNA